MLYWQDSSTEHHRTPGKLFFGSIHRNSDADAAEGSEDEDNAAIKNDDAVGDDSDDGSYRLHKSAVPVERADSGQKLNTYFHAK